MNNKDNKENKDVYLAIFKIGENNQKFFQKLYFFGEINLEKQVQI